MNATSFALTGIDLPQGRDPLGVWSLEPPEATAFAGHETGDDSLIWRVRLPDSTQEANRILQSQLRTVTDKRSALQALETMFPHMTPGVNWNPEDRTVESALWRGVVLARSMTTADSTVRSLGAAPNELIGRAKTLFERIRRLLTGLAWVETERSGAVVGITRVNWRGDFKTTWSPDASEESMGLHLKSVRLALASRLALLQMVTVVVGGALVLASRASVPGGQVLLIPVVYGYVLDILAAWEDVRDTVAAE